MSDYCMTCDGECKNTDPEDFEHLHSDFDSLVGGWMDRGASPPAIWAFMASVLLAIAKENGLSYKEVDEALSRAWKRGDVS